VVSLEEEKAPHINLDMDFTFTTTTSSFYYDVKGTVADSENLMCNNLRSRCIHDLADEYPGDIYEHY